MSSIRLTDGRAGRVALVAGRDNPKGAMVIVANAEAPPVPAPLSSVMDSVQPADAVEIVCMQERVFGANGLPAADVA